MKLASTVQLLALGLALVLGCHKEPRAEIVKPPARNGRNPTPTNRSDGSVPDSRDAGQMLADAGGGAGRSSNEGGRGDDPPQAGEEGASGSEGAAGDGPERPIETPPFTKIGLIEAAAACTLDHYRAFEARAVALAEATQAATDAGGTSLGAARRAWLAANAAWQRAELFRVGPAAPSSDPGGQDMRDQ